MTASMDYAALLDMAVDTEPAHTVWTAADIGPLTLDQIDVIRDARRSEFEERFAETFADSVTATELREALDKPPVILQSRVLAALELAARCVLFSEAVEEADRREYDATFGEADERGEQAYQRAKGEGEAL